MPAAVLVPVDSSNFAEHALPYALGIARSTGATLHLALVHVPGEPVSAAYPFAAAVAAQEDQQREHETRYLEELVGRLKPSGVPIRPALLTGRVAGSLARYVHEQGIGLVVMTTHGRGGIQRAWLGSTADSLVRECMIPILLVRPSDQTREIGPDSDRRLRRLLAALDGSATAETALRDALELGIPKDAAIVLVHVVQPALAATSPYLPHAIQLGHDQMIARETQMRRYLEALAATAMIGGRPTDVRLEVDYHAAPALLDIAEEVDADLIVLGTHGRAGLRRLILGSVADEVIRGTHRPVLVHRGAGRIAQLTRPLGRHKTSQSAAAPVHP